MHVRGPTLLVIEDSSDQALLFGAAARRARAGLDVHTAAHGLEGIAYLAGLAPFDDRRVFPVPDLILLDLIMPEMDGFEVLEWIRDREPSFDIPVVVLTSSPDPQDIERAMSLGATEAYRKPTDLQELASLVRDIVDRSIPRGEMIGAHIWAAG